MEAVNQWLSWPRVAGTVAAYLISIAVYRLYFHPLAKFPGPKLAAITRYYEGYYDLFIHSGQYTFKIGELHKKYGPIVRISPHELHINDHAYFNTLYRQEGVWDKYDWAVDAFASSLATLFTVDHYLHKARRQPLNGFLSKSKVASQSDLIQKHIHKLQSRLSALAQSAAEFDLGASLTAFSRDVANELIFGKHYGSLDKEDFDVAMVIATQGPGPMWRATKFFRWLGPGMRLIPPSWILKVADPITKKFFTFLLEGMADTRKIMADINAPETDDNNTIVHEILRSKLPESEKKFNRVFQDVSTIGGAAYETTASSLRLILFHSYSNPNILQRLRTELASAAQDQASRQLELKTLERLPYLTSVLMEGLRLSPGIATRMGRVARDRELVYNNKTIPAGTPVGMTLILLHMDETYYPEPERFNPNRWMEPDPWRNSNKVFAPFSRGTRNCLGMHLAWAEMYLVMACLIRNFNFQFPDAKAEDFKVTSDQFAIGTQSQGRQLAIASQRVVLGSV